MCAAYKLGIPHDIMDVKWFRNEKEISDQSSFKLIERDLLIKVGINFLYVIEIALNSRPKNLPLACILFCINDYGLYVK